MNTTDDIDITTDATIHPIAIVNLSAVSPAMAAVEVFKSTNGLRVRLPLSTEARPVSDRLNARNAEFILKMNGRGGGRPGWRGLERWYSPTNTPEDPRDIATMELIRKQDRVMAGKEPPPVFTRADTQPYLGDVPSPGAMRVKAGVIPAPGWPREMLIQWKFRNGIDSMPGENLDTKDGLSAALAFYAGIANELAKYRHLRAPDATAGVQAKAEAAARRIAPPAA